MIRAVVLALAIGTAGSAGCNGDLTADNLAAKPRASAIQGGDNDTTHLFAVGILAQTDRGVGLCSGALLAPNLVATARHCVAALPANGLIGCPDTQFGALTPVGDLLVTTDADVRTGATTYAVSQLIMPSGADQTSVCGHDIALLILTQNISLPQYVFPVIDPPMNDHTVYSTTVTDIGYGLSSATDTAGTTAGIRRIKQNVKLACIPNDKSFADCFPSEQGVLTAAEFMSGSGTCEGDSGSNAFEQTSFDAGKWVSFGVLSRGGTSGATCLGGIYTRFDAWGSLIIDAAKQAATKGGYAPPSWAGQDGGAGVPVDAGTGDASRDAGAARDSSSGPATISDAGAAKDSGTAGDGSRPTADGGAASDSGSIGPPTSAGGCGCMTAGPADAPQDRPRLTELAGLALALAGISVRRRSRRRVSRPHQ